MKKTPRPGSTNDVVEAEKKMHPGPDGQDVTIRLAIVAIYNCRGRKRRVQYAKLGAETGNVQMIGLIPRQ